MEQPFTIDRIRLCLEALRDYSEADIQEMIEQVPEDSEWGAVRTTIEYVYEAADHEVQKLRAENEKLRAEIKRLSGNKKRKS
jgi:cell division protein FtsB